MTTSRSKTTEAETPASTTLDADNTAPSVTAPGDGPADTTDPTEEASSITPAPGPEAVAVGTVNAVQPIPAPEKPAEPKGKARIEKYEQTGPDGKLVKLERNIDTGATKVIK
ncbi:hypothetical protein GRS96_12390 [Rathayibacter sp. VKM Ac-2803]|uniref:hypothetical protein n=1 Tax=Rathayibacter sp. VKM Ac-2803 TaxID=2609256 RepID=UPI00135BD634|nr:hypothetical protein [Rathayibacter sp. VKM Ac-2803]MWV50068.1 hypothetical protein [Rathayibacter sp. VKM Ac-2803]